MQALKSPPRAAARNRSSVGPGRWPVWLDIRCSMGRRTWPPLAGRGVAVTVAVVPFKGPWLRGHGGPGWHHERPSSLTDPYHGFVVDVGRFMFADPFGCAGREKGRGSCWISSSCAETGARGPGCDAGLALPEDAPVAQALALDERRRAIRVRAEVLPRRAQQRLEADRPAHARWEARPRGRRCRRTCRPSATRSRRWTKSWRRWRRSLQDAMLRIPEMCRIRACRSGPTSCDNVVVRQWGEPRAFDFEPLPHWDSARAGHHRLRARREDDPARASMFCAALARGCSGRSSPGCSICTREHGYTEVYPPYMVQGGDAGRHGHLPKFGDNVYRDAEEDLWFIPTAEVPVTNLYRDEILDGAICRSTRWPTPSASGGRR